MSSKSKNLREILRGGLTKAGKAPVTDADLDAFIGAHSGPSTRPRLNHNDDARSALTQNEAAEALGIDLQPFVDEYAETGKLGPTSYKALAAHGYSPHIVDAFVTGLRGEVGETTDTTKATDDVSSPVDRPAPTISRKHNMEATVEFPNPDPAAANRERPSIGGERPAIAEATSQGGGQIKPRTITAEVPIPSGDE